MHQITDLCKEVRGAEVAPSPRTATLLGGDTVTWPQERGFSWASSGWYMKICLQQESHTVPYFGLQKLNPVLESKSMSLLVQPCADRLSGRFTS